MKVKSENEVALSDPMDCSLPGSFVYGIFQARVLEWVAIAFSEDFLSQTHNTPLYYIIYLCSSPFPYYWRKEEEKFINICMAKKNVNKK